MKFWIIVIGSVAGLLLAWWFWFPDPLFRTPYSTILLDKHGELMGGRIASDGQWRFPEDELVVPETFEKAILQFEDKRYYRHGGVDILAMLRACVDNVRAGKIVSGGSTLTMQTMRLARQPDSRSLWQKGIEMLWAWRAELTFSKKEILRLYAAHAPFGGNVVGLSAASWRYYHKTPDQLSWGEACALAVLPNAPGLIHPGRNRDALRNKRDFLIRSLQRSGVLDTLEASLALEEKLPDTPEPLPDLAPHVITTFAQNGQALHSTLDAGWQERLSELLQRHADILSLNGVNNAALLVLSTETGEVLAYVGNTRDPMRRHHNDVDIIKAERSSGSILKPFLYCASLEDNLITPGGLLEDVPTYIRGYQPLNFSKQYMGMVSADQALAMSLNVPAVRLLQTYGLMTFREKLQHAGITTLHYSAEHYGLPLILGGAEVTLWDVCGAYASMGRVLNHVYTYDHQYTAADIHPPVLEQKDKDAQGTLSLTNIPSLWQAGAIYETFEAMRTLRRPDQEGQWETFNSSRRIAWKTGTSFGFRDAWAVGVTPTYTIGVWIGNADGEGRPGVIGLHAAAPVLFDALRMLNPPDEWWNPPYDALKPAVVCRESGWLAGPLCATVDTAYIIPGDATPPVCDFHRKVYVDQQGHYRFDPACMPPDAVEKTFFTVPTLAESYYRKYHPEYAVIPPMSPDCKDVNATDKSIAIIYPRSGAQIYVPYEWDRKKSRAVFSAVHRSDTTAIYWHLDKAYLGKTTEFHQIEVDPAPGHHILTLQDEHGAIATASFDVLSK